MPNRVIGDPIAPLERVGDGRPGVYLLTFAMRLFPYNIGYYERIHPLQASSCRQDDYPISQKWLRISERFYKP